jgi:hypothetical protein
MPISQGDEIRRLRKESEGLKAIIRQANLPLPGGKRMSDKSLNSSITYGTFPQTSLRQHKPQAVERIDNLYFGSPSVAAFVADVS